MEPMQKEQSMIIPDCAIELSHDSLSGEPDFWESNAHFVMGSQGLMTVANVNGFSG
jgi:hypothetical protein